ncbi:MAG: sigma-70 family RNA polymerase sigma factor [Sedimentisphaerales bacterium]|nr:sigma-70 family RNA polymerase sigma factor [Sedimentisphaerales bacterium]
MAESEFILLRRFSGNGDSEAFAQIIKQHAPMVYGVCLRILSNREIAADVVQDTFFQLVCDAAEITDSLSNWLHSVATYKAINLVRSDSRRKQRELIYAADSKNAESEDNKAAWREISFYIDEEIEKLDVLTREVIILHFFEGQKMTEIAEKFDISQPTVSRKIESGLDSLRKKLTSRGVIVPAAILSALLTENIVQAAPAFIMKELGKIAIAGSKVVTGASITAGVSTAIKAKIIATAAIITISVGSVAIYHNSNNALKASMNTQSAWDLVRQGLIKNTDSNAPAESNSSLDLLQVETQTGERILHFPKERSIGRLSIADEGTAPDVPNPFEEVEWESFGSAQGDVKIPKGKILQLILYSWTWQNPSTLSLLEKLKPDDIYSLTLSPKWSIGGQSPNDKCLPYVLHLSELKTLNIDGANITTKGLESLAGLKSLKSFCPPANVYDSGLAAVGKIKSLQVIRMSEDNSMTNAGLKQLTNLKSLRILQIPAVRVTDEGLKVLSELPNLNYLMLSGNFTNNAPLYLKDVSSLRAIKIDSEQFDDSGMKNLARLTQLESIDVYWNNRITDEGVKYLKNLPNLKTFSTLRGKLSDEGLSHLQECKNIESLFLPDSFSDEGLSYLGRMSKLKHLDRVGGTYTDKGVAELAKCKRLESLVINSRNVTDESLRYISELKNLESLSVIKPDISDEGIKYIAKLTNLKQLNISGKRLTNKAIEELAPLKSLIELAIGGDAISVSGLKHLNNFKNLKYLNMQGIKQDNSEIMDISGLTELVDMILFLNAEMNYRDGSLSNIARFRDEDWACLANLTKLNRLQISGFGITDNGMKYLSGLKNLESLSIQCLREVGITDKGIQCLADLSKLNRLTIMDGHFTDKSLDYLSNLPALTSLELTSDYAFSLKAIKNLQVKNPYIDNLKIIP